MKTELQTAAILTTARFISIT